MRISPRSYRIGTQHAIQPEMNDAIPWPQTHTSPRPDKVLKADELVEAILVPRLRAFEYVFPFKQARRREDDIGIVTSGMRIYLAPNFDKSVFIIKDASLAFGGMAPTTAIALKTT